MFECTVSLYFVFSWQRNCHKKSTDFVGRLFISKLTFAKFLFTTSTSVSFHASLNFFFNFVKIMNKAIYCNCNWGLELWFTNPWISSVEDWIGQTWMEWYLACAASFVWICRKHNNSSQPSTKDHQDQSIVGTTGPSYWHRQLTTSCLWYWPMMKFSKTNFQHFSDSDNPNKDISDFLLELCEFEKNVTRNVYKANAYKKAAGVISKLTERVKSGAEVPQNP